MRVPENVQLNRRDFLSRALRLAAGTGLGLPKLIALTGCGSLSGGTPPSNPGTKCLDNSVQGCYDTSHPEALAAYTRAISSPRFLQAVPVDETGKPSLIAGSPVIGQFLAEGNKYDPRNATDICGNQFKSPEDYFVHRMEQHRCLTGKSLATAKAYSFYSWKGMELHLPKAMLDAIHRQGATPFLGDAPMDCGNPEGNLYLMSELAAGKYDDQIRRRGGEIRDLGYYLFYSWGGEMNGSWYPYGRADLGNTPQAFAAAVRHVYDLYQKEGATNLIWVYSPNVATPSSRGEIDNAALEKIDHYYPYPGPGQKDFIDLIAPDLYNWGKAAYPWGKTTNLSFDQLARDTFTFMRNRHPGHHFGIGEMGTSSIGVDMAAWIQAAYSKMLGAPYNVSFALYFNPPGDDLTNPPRWPYKSNLF